jgi:16S rRNA (uracil1498-N3)-methyltransferase
MDAVVPDMDRFFASASAWQEGQVSLDQDESHHCLRVMRKQLGDEIEVFDGEGCWARGVIAESEDGVVRVEVRDEGRAEERPPLITLAVAIPKGKTMELIVQKAVELGASAIQPLMTEHTVVRVDGKEALKKREKWQRVAVEACKQCGRNVLPPVHAPATLEDWLAMRGGRAGLVASLAKGAVPMRTAIEQLPEELAELDLLIGPEGDLSLAETEAATAGGFQAVSFGEITLRMETAVMFGLSVLGYELA